MRYDRRLLLWCLTVVTGGLSVFAGGSKGVFYPYHATHPSYLPPQRSQRQVYAKLVMADVINRLGVKLLAIQNEYNENNIAISPYGALSVLIALGEGLQGDAVREIQLAAQIPNDITIIRHGLRDINRDLQSYFIPKEGFLAGLTLNYDNVSLKPQYQDILIYYGYDITAFNVALYPPPQKQSPPESTTTTTNQTTTSTIAPINTSPTQITERSITIETITSTQSTTMETSTNPTTANPTSTMEVSSTPTTATPITTMEPSTTSTTAIPITTMETSTTQTTATPVTTMETSTTPTTVTATSTPETSSSPTTVSPITTMETSTTTTDTMTTTIQPVTTIITITNTGEPSNTSTTRTIIPNNTSPSSTSISETNSTTKIDPFTTYSSNSTLSTTPSYITPIRTINTDTRSAFLAPSNLTSVNLSKLRHFNQPLTGTDTGAHLSEVSTESIVTTTSSEPMPPTTTLSTTQNVEAIISTQTTPVDSTSELLTNMPTTVLSVQLTTTEEETTEYKMESTTEAPVELTSTDKTETEGTGTTEQRVISTEAMTEETIEQETTESVTDETTEQQIPTTEGMTESSMATTEALITEEMTENSMKQQLATTDATMTALGFAGSPKQKRMSKPSPISLNKWSWTDKIPSRRVAKSVSEYIKYQKPFYYTTYSYPRPVNPSMSQEPPYFLVQGRYKEYNVNFMRYNTMLPACDVAHLDARALKFPLDRKEYYLLILLPNRDNGVDKLVRDLRFNGDLRQIVDGLRTMHVDVTIPSFKMSGYVRLTPLFQRLGIKQVFEPNQADFTPMTDQKQIYVTSIEQAITVNIKHYVDIESMIPKNSYLWEFKANHPFLFFVMDSELQVSLMSGKVTNPLNTRIS
ncbi:unnamed protein product [Phaedon cochleariae]|uniref:Serpin domain-containing protein n=1 Tax=Phaedon cochleariae TaxID=80249 RepID=A0A9P0GWZ4_PHACE|nr:unnamed protein product [Phaedon cochleariae]